MLCFWTRGAFLQCCSWLIALNRRVSEHCGRHSILPPVTTRFGLCEDPLQGFRMVGRLESVETRVLCVFVHGSV